MPEENPYFINDEPTEAQLAGIDSEDALYAELEKKLAELKPDYEPDSSRLAVQGLLPLLGAAILGGGKGVAAAAGPLGQLYERETDRAERAGDREYKKGLQDVAFKEKRAARRQELLDAVKDRNFTRSKFALEQKGLEKRHSETQSRLREQAAASNALRREQMETNRLMKQSQIDAQTERERIRAEERRKTEELIASLTERRDDKNFGRDMTKEAFRADSAMGRLNAKIAAQTERDKRQNEFKLEEQSREFGQEDKMQTLKGVQAMSQIGARGEVSKELEAIRYDNRTAENLQKYKFDLQKLAINNAAELQKQKEYLAQKLGNDVALAGVRLQNKLVETTQKLAQVHAYDIDKLQASDELLQARSMVEHLNARDLVELKAERQEALQQARSVAEQKEIGLRYDRLEGVELLRIAARQVEQQRDNEEKLKRLMIGETLQSEREEKKQKFQQVAANNAAYLKEQTAINKEFRERTKKLQEVSHFVPQFAAVLEDPNGISIGSLGFLTPRFYGEVANLAQTEQERVDISTLSRTVQNIRQYLTSNPDIDTLPDAHKRVLARIAIKTRDIIKRGVDREVAVMRDMQGRNLAPTLSRDSQAYGYAIDSLGSNIYSNLQMPPVVYEIGEMKLTRQQKEELLRYKREQAKLWGK